MTTKPYHTEVKDFISLMIREGIGSLHIGALIQKANTLQKLATRQCSERWSDHDEKTVERTREFIRSITVPYGIEPIFSRDPRGACVKVKVPSGKTDDWGSTGICVPTRNF